MSSGKSYLPMSITQVRFRHLNFATCLISLSWNLPHLVSTSLKNHINFPESFITWISPILSELVIPCLVAMLLQLIVFAFINPAFFVLSRAQLELLFEFVSLGLLYYTQIKALYYNLGIFGLQR